ncbi:MAG TPA: hypothetical protein VEA41_16845 [Salinarimonas sp.]|nr:hypothetical protein [Salinarimonas sp.]
MNRRNFFLGTLGLLAAPSIVRAASLMPVRAPRVGGYVLCERKSWTFYRNAFDIDMDIAEFERRLFAPAAQRLAVIVERDALAAYRAVYADEHALASLDLTP